MRRINFLGYLAMPLALLVHFWLGHDANGATKPWEPTLTFILSGIAIIPLAWLMGEATENLAEKTGPTWGGLLNATFGNAAELIIGIVAISKGLNDVAKASLAGSILGNLLLVSGAAMLVGGWRRERQTFSRATAEANAGLLTVAVTALLLPAIFHYTYAHLDPHLVEHENGMSTGASIVLLAVYALGLLFTLRTHRHIFSPAPARTPEDPAGISALGGGGWSVRKSIITLVIASVVTAIFSELLVGSVEQTAHHLGWNKVFVGVIVLAIIGNAAEHSTAVMLARRNDMDTAMAITYQSSLQIALFVTPFLVLLSTAFVAFGMKGAHRMDLIFTPLEVVGVYLSVTIVVVIGRNGETNWFEGVLLLAVYAILAITFFYIPSARLDGYDTGDPARARNEPGGLQHSGSAAL
ncbi:MAG: calcium/proton antiporter, CaCA family [Phycisphaerales bacterium]|nr:calcium/proton antiporter, CaCA family [Phycisphaerales bacterium]MDB5355093.1 calcium/proton antiporter, CaCA family [Phycisphaerales bacterium]